MIDESEDDDDEPDYEGDIEELFGEDPDPPQGTQTLEQRKAVHEALAIFDKHSGDERAPYVILCGKRVHNLGVCRHVDVQPLVGEWIWGQMILKNGDVMQYPIHVFRRSKLRYVYTAKDIAKYDDFTLVTCEKVTVPAGMIQEALLEETLIGFRFFGKTDLDREEGL